MKSLVTALLLLTVALPARADLKDGFARIAKESKGPFGLNILQGTGGRTLVTSGKAPKGFLFQAAYRNDTARELAEREGFYLGNLFSTNYYELMGEYVYSDPYGTHGVDHKALAQNGHRAIAKAALMVQHWVLEKHYIEHFPASRLARSFQLRGISSYENEVTFAGHFFSFYLGAMDNEAQYLPAFLLVKESPIADNSSLAKARNLVTEAYDYVLARFGDSDERTRAMYRLRNAIHNQLTSDVIGQIDQYLKTYPFYLKEGHTNLGAIRKILVEYYSFNVAKLGKEAEKVGLKDLKKAADQIAAKGVTEDTLNDLSWVAANWRAVINDADLLPVEKRAAALLLLANTTRYLNKELGALKAVNSPKVTEAIVNTVYAEGFLLKDNWDYFKSEAASTSDPITLLTDVIDIASSSTLDEAFKPAFAQWVSLEPKMQYFHDNTIKSSALQTASITIEKLRK